jgi:Uma2 family endonuclease
MGNSWSGIWDPNPVTSAVDCSRALTDSVRNTTWESSGPPIMASSVSLTNPGSFERPDISFVRRGRLPGDVPPKGWVKIPPDLAVEVLSPNDRVYDLDEKLADYRKVRVPLVWVINPESRTATVYRADGSVRILFEDDELSGEDVIPGFSCPLREILPPRQPADEAHDAPAGPNGAGPA